MANKKITQITVEEMYNELGKRIKLGEGGKYLVCADDNEGNGYHGCFFTISPFDAEMAEQLSDSQVTDPDKLLIIG